MTAHYAFGFLERRLDFADAQFEVRPRKLHEQAVKRVRNSPSAGPKWFHPPLEPSLTERVTVPAGRFELPPTHLLITPGRPYNAAYGEFIVLVLGFIYGLRLTIRGTGHLHPTPLREHSLVNFAPKRAEVLSCLAKATALWDSQSPDIRQLIFGAIHWHLVAQSYNHQHERFAWAYTVLDNLHRIAWHISPAYRVLVPSEVGAHSKRPVALAQVYGTPLPSAFADALGAPGNVAVLVASRNQLIHEARWQGKPIGYAVSQVGHEMILNLQHFCSQIILGLLDIECLFRRHQYSGQLQGLDLPP